MRRRRMHGDRYHRSTVDAPRRHRAPSGTIILPPGGPHARIAGARRREPVPVPVRGSTHGRNVSPLMGPGRRPQSRTARRPPRRDMTCDLPIARGIAVVLPAPTHLDTGLRIAGPDGGRSHRRSPPRPTTARAVAVGRTSRRRRDMYTALRLYPPVNGASRWSSVIRSSVHVTQQDAQRLLHRRQACPRPLTRAHHVVVRRLDGLAVALQLGLRSARADEDPHAAVETDAQHVGREPGHLGHRVIADPPRRVLDQAGDGRIPTFPPPQALVEQGEVPRHMGTVQPVETVEHPGDRLVADGE